MIIYHKIDFDGVGSAALVSHLEHDKNFFGVNYNDFSIEELYNRVEADTKRALFVVDFSFEPEIMDKLSKMKSLIWIDHHKTAIDKIGKNVYDGLQSTDMAAIQLVAKYFNYKKTKFIDLIGNWDIWNHDKENNCLHFQNFLPCIPDIYNPSCKYWERVFNESIYDSWFNVGYHVNNLNNNKSKSALLKGFLCTLNFEGNTYNGYILPVGTFVNLLKPLDFTCKYLYKPTNGIKISLYSNDVNKLNVGNICKTFEGGGGHPGAAGFTVQDFPKELIQIGRQITLDDLIER